MYIDIYLYWFLVAETRKNLVSGASAIQEQPGGVEPNDPAKAFGGCVFPIFI